DVADYYNVDPRYGTLGDFIEFTHGAKQRGIRVLIDLVVNHTSDQHPWFKQARSDPNSKYRDWYVWSKKKQPHAKEGMVFPGVQKTTWNYDREAKAWYFHRFYDFQPDLNASNPEVQAEILKIMGFWIQAGVSGFRMDAVPFIISTKGPKVRKPKEQFDMLRVFREFLQWRQGDCIVLAEANVVPETDMDYFGEDGERMHMMFNFQVNQHLFYALAAADTRPLIKALKATNPRPATAQQWSNEPHGGFTKNAKPHTPVIDKGPYGYQHVNAAIQRRHADSMLNWAERIIRMRKEVPEIGWGDFTVLNVRDPAVLALRYDWRNNSVLFLHNLHEQPREILLDPRVSGAHGKLLVNLLAEDHSRANESGKHRIVLEGYGYRWYRVGGLDYLLRRTEIDQDDTRAG